MFLLTKIVYDYFQLPTRKRMVFGLKTDVF